MAKKVKGVQIGLINYMEDGEAGVSIGLINVAKYGGKYEFEVSFSEAVNTMFSFRIGTDRFYTMFSGGINYAAYLEYCRLYGKTPDTLITMCGAGLKSDH